MLAGLAAGWGPGLSARQFSSGVNVVEVYASVTSERGEPVTGLPQGDFELRENGEVHAAGVNDPIRNGNMALQRYRRLRRR